MVERIPSPGVSAPLPVRPAAALERAADPRLEAFQRTLATMLGSQVQASVLARMQDGSFLVRVAETPVRMVLPQGTQPGAQLHMTVLAASPQPTFGLGDATVHGQAVAPGLNAAALASAIAAASPPSVPGGGQHAAADLSPAARLLAQVLQGAAPGAPAPLAGTAPLAPQGAPDPAQLAMQLRDAISKSGLFYESHLAQWADGKRPLAELMGEPQARMAPGTPPTETATAQLINQQLATQEQGHIAWQGQLAPGQPFRWDITREEGEPGQSGQDEAPGWHSSLRLRFAALGEVEARVSLHGKRLQVELRAGIDAAGLMRAGAPHFQNALAAAGTELAALRIRGPEDK